MRIKEFFFQYLQSLKRIVFTRQKTLKSKKQQMQENKELRYQIMMKKKIIGEGDIENIKKRLLNKRFELLSEMDESFQIDLKFLSPSIATKIQLRLIRTYRYSLRLMNCENKLIQQFSDLIQDKEGRVTLNPILTQSISLVRLRIQNDPFNMKRIGINYIYFQGFSDEKIQTNKNPKSKITSNTHFKDQVIRVQQSLKRDQKSINSKDFFNGRQKLKSVKDDVQRLLGFSQKQSSYMQRQMQRIQLQKIQQKLKKKVKHNESTQKSSKNAINKQIDIKLQFKQETDLAIALSKSENQHIVEIQNHSQNMDLEEFKKQSGNLPIELENYVDNILQNSNRKYQTVELNEEYMSYFSDLTPKWVEAQKLAEIQIGVREEERLSKHIKLKHLIGVQVYISDFAEWKVQDLKHQAKQLGCRVISQLKNHCIAFVPKETCEKLRKKHKAWNEIKFLNSEYLHDCIKHQSRLPYKNYYLKI